MFGDINLQDIIIRTIAVLVAIIPHEMAHGYAAYLCGDETAKNDGRLSLNPLHHLDPIGTICLIFFKFGWAKPVMINPNNFRDRKKGTFFVSIAGVLTNFILAIISVIIIKHIRLNDFVFELFMNIFWFNIVLGVFNLIPIPPLDGSKLLFSFLPLKYEYYLIKYEKYGYIILLLLVMSNNLDKILIPMVNFMINLIGKIV
ncbi:MAG: site-2 protease family protein [Eubacteriales bacterium]|uniref:site-2 protease family protein n=1 Tax=Fenollaria sp. TaxID=1965292 RepID=UPI002A74AB2F|nr:site-2 protease family protein [Fenollaria sp.]MDD7339225.1 site-2 protease family protein [Eubacteriales bacterium]MDY3106221.1 site-2 protease family protein [Fenollaria sp.]